jgi:hypothetical protein
MRGSITIYCLVNHHITGHLVFVLVSTESVTDNPTSCKICAVICFINAKNMSAVEIYCELCAVYSQNVLSEGTLKQWCRMIKDGRANKWS